MNGLRPSTKHHRSHLRRATRIVEPCSGDHLAARSAAGSRRTRFARSLGLVVCSLGLLALLPSPDASAIPIYFEPTGHYYEFIRQAGVTWTEAAVAATEHEHEGMTGYLATLTSAAENDLVYESFGQHFWEAWLGGYQDPTSIPSEKWHWTTGEEWAYTNWAPGEPNDAGGPDKECYLQMWGQGTVAPGHWNDDAAATDLGNIGGYLVEFGGGAPPVPEPSSLVLLTLGLGTGLVRIRRRRHS